VFRLEPMQSKEVRDMAKKRFALLRWTLSVLSALSTSAFVVFLHAYA
jgi:hypothetical protein